MVHRVVMAILVVAAVAAAAKAQLVVEGANGAADAEDRDLGQRTEEETAAAAEQVVEKKVVGLQRSAYLPPVPVAPTLMAAVRGGPAC